VKPILNPILNLMPNPSLMPDPLLLSNPLLPTALLPIALLLNSLIGMAFLVRRALIVHLMHLQIIIRIVSLKRSTLAGYILQLKSGLQIKLKDDIKGVVIATFKRGIKGGQLVSYVSYKIITLIHGLL
jgi:hypothetical protein